MEESRARLRRTHRRKVDLARKSLMCEKTGVGGSFQALPDCCPQAGRKQAWGCACRKVDAKVARRWCCFSRSQDLERQGPSIGGRSGSPDCFSDTSACRVGPESEIAALARQWRYLPLAGTRVAAGHYRSRVFRLRWDFPLGRCCCYPRPPRCASRARLALSEHRWSMVKQV